MKDRLDETLSRLLETLYSSVTEPQRWQDFLIEVSAAMSAKSALLRIEDRDMSRVAYALHHGLDPALQAAYPNHFLQMDPYVKLLKARSVGKIYPGESGIAYRELTKTEYFTDYMRPQNNHFVAGGIIQRDELFSIQFALQRDRSAGPFHSRDISFLQLLVPHLRQAVALQKRIGIDSIRQLATETALDRLSIALLLLNDRGGLEYANHAGESLLQSRRGLRLVLDRVTAVDDSEAREVRRLIRQARMSTGGDTPAAGVMLLSEQGRGERNLFLFVRPLLCDQNTLHALFERACVAVFCGPVRQGSTIGPYVLHALYGLTAAESRLAVCIVQGLDLKEIAARCEISVNTLKTQLKAVFQKTGARRQQDLVGLLAGVPWNLME